MGNHTVGVIVLNELLKTTDVAAVFAYSDHHEDGTLYLSVKETAKKSGVPVFQFGKRQYQYGEVKKVISEIIPDLIVVADYKYLLKREIIEIPKIGCINFHPSLLPKYRGGAPVNWAIIKGENKCGLSVHYIDEGLDTGDIIIQEEIDILFEDTVKDIHDKLFPLYADCTNRVIELFKRGNPPRYKQDHFKATIFPRRVPEDGLIDWSRTTKDIYNFIRAITYPYPGAFSFIRGKKYLIWSSMFADEHKMIYKESVPGEICYVGRTGIGVRTGDGIIQITKIHGTSDGMVNFNFNPHLFFVGQKFILYREEI